MGEIDFWKEAHTIQYPNKKNSKNLPWDIGKPDLNLVWVLNEYEFQKGNALELGCGLGSDAVYLDNIGFEVDAIDINEKFINFAHTKKSNVNFICGDVFHDLPNKKYDLIFDRGFLHNINYDLYPKIFNLLKSKLSKGGKIVAITGHPYPHPSSYVTPNPTPIHEIVLSVRGIFQPILIKEIDWELNEDYDDNLGMLYVLKHLNV